jgi:hypothetical protein
MAIVAAADVPDDARAISRACSRRPTTCVDVARAAKYEKPGAPAPGLSSSASSQRRLGGPTDIDPLTLPPLPPLEPPLDPPPLWFINQYMPSARPKPWLKPPPPP